jgi:hypothetical protein
MPPTYAVHFREMRLDSPVLIGTLCSPTHAGNVEKRVGVGMFGLVSVSGAEPRIAASAPPGSLALQGWLTIRGRSTVFALYPCDERTWVCIHDPLGSSEVTLTVAYVTNDGAQLELSIQADEGWAAVPDGYVLVGGGSQGRGRLLVHQYANGKWNSQSTEGLALAYAVGVRRRDGKAIASDWSDPDVWCCDLGEHFGEWVRRIPHHTPRVPKNAFDAARHSLGADERAHMSLLYCRRTTRR